LAIYEFTTEDAEDAEKNKSDIKPLSGCFATVKYIAIKNLCVLRVLCGETMPNKLAEEKSPYLLQHAHNPVDWLPWGEDAFALARKLDRPIFLSIGYSTCHWCHVMERESFENEETARLMNEYFVNIKVDREERPDVDRLYMTFVQATTGSGGWPLSVFLTPDLKPFFGGTYFPPREGYGRIGFPALLQRIADAWKNDRKSVLESGESVINALQRYAALEGRSTPGDADWARFIEDCAQHYKASYDARRGGFGEAPKFPRPVTHDFLHRYFLQCDDRDALQMSEQTLIAMGNGGMNDQLGGGFHRYAVDAQWIVSHFEKMLYDQAQLVVSYLEMYQLTRDEYFASIARSTLDYVLRDMTHSEGGFFAAEDADSYAREGDAHKEEGAFYVWTQGEIEEILGGERAPIFCEYFGVQQGGNAPPDGDPHGEFRGKNILYRAKSLVEVAQKFFMAPEDVAGVLEACRAELFAAREKRPRPHRDEKIIVAWNGLMISAFARAAQVLDEPRYLEAAERAAGFIERHLWDESTASLRRHYKDGATDVPAFAEDYAFLMRGLLDLYEASFDSTYLQWAEKLYATLERDFGDEASGGYFSSAPDPKVLLRFKEDYDGAEPSANSVAAENLVRLWQLTDRDEFRERAEAVFGAFSARISQVPAAMPFLLSARMRLEAPPLHVVIIGEKNADDTRQLLRVVREPFLPDKVLVLLSDESREETPKFMARMKRIGGRATAYVCRDFVCRQPTNDPEELRAQLKMTP
jgi:uncharacterized protein YyaL (SSP411 family)